jgi:drug/metabolite transporter (DMT)-like permease
MSSGFTKYDVEMLVVSLIWGGNFSASKFAMHQFSPLAFSGLRFALAAVLLVLIALKARVLAPLPRRTFWGLAGLGVLGNTLYQTAFMTGLSLTTATNSAMIVAFLPVLVALLAALLGIERASAAMWLGVALGTAGVALVVTARGVRFDAASFRGDLLVLFAILCWACYTVGVRRIGAGVDALQITVITTVAGTPGLVLLGGAGLLRQDWRTISVGTWGALAYAALLALVFCYVLYNRAVQGIGTARTAIYNCLVPLVAMAIAWVTLGEVLSGIQLLGVVLVIGGVLVSIRTKSPAREPAVVPE